MWLSPHSICMCLHTSIFIIVVIELLIFHLALLLSLTPSSSHHQSSNFLSLFSSHFNRHEIVLSQKEWDMIKSLGYTLVDLLDKNVVIFPSSLLASLLLYHHYNYNDTNKGDAIKLPVCLLCNKFCLFD